jgi:hypothetical protein
MIRPSNLLVCLVLLVAGSSVVAQGYAPNSLYVTQVPGVAELALDGTVLRTFGTEDMITPSAIAFGPNGLLHGVDQNLDVVAVFGHDGLLQPPFYEDVGLDTPMDLAFGQDGRLFVAALGSGTVEVFASDGDHLDTLGDDIDGLTAPCGLAFGPDGHLFVVDRDADRIFELDDSGAEVGQLGVGSGLDVPWGVAVAPDGALFVASTGTDEIYVFGPDGAVQDVLDGQGGVIGGPRHLSVGPDGDLLVVGQAEGLLLVVDRQTGAVEGEIGPFGGLPAMFGVAVAPFRWKAVVSGILERGGSKSVRRKATGVLSLAPGSGTIMLALDDKDANADLAAVFGTETLVFHGFEAHADALAKKRQYHGQLVFDQALGGGVATTALVVNGKIGDEELFAPRKAGGALLFSGAAGAFSGTLRSRKPITLD